MEGSGTLNLADETLALQMRPLVRLGGTGVAVPVRVGGTFRSPSARLDPSGAAGEAGRQAEAAGGRVFGLVIGALGANGMIAGTGAAAPTDCAAELAIARGGRAGALPAARPAAAEAAPKPLKPADLLRQFLR